jgi:Domain of unknown function (DUF5069)
MEPLDLRERPPRGPRAMLAGLMFTPRAIDKIRASLPGGDLSEYFTDIGMSVVWARYTKIDLDALREVVAQAKDEAAVERWIAERTEHLDKARINAKLERIATSQVPPEWADAFNRAYPLELRERHRIIFDLIEADDARR